MEMLVVIAKVISVITYRYRIHSPMPSGRSA